MCAPLVTTLYKMQPNASPWSGTLTETLFSYTKPMVLTPLFKSFGYLAHFQKMVTFKFIKCATTLTHDNDANVTIYISTLLDKLHTFLQSR